MTIVFPTLFWIFWTLLTGRIFATDHQEPMLHPTSNFDGKSKANVSIQTTCVTAYEGMSPRKLARYVDASGKIGSGVYGGNTRWFGSFSECNKQPDSRYCVTMFPGEINLGAGILETKSLYWGVCVPSVCRGEDVADELEALLNISKLRVKPTQNKLLRNVECAEDPEYTTGVISTIVFFGFLLGLCLLATVIELLNDLSNGDEDISLEKSNHISMENEPNEKTLLLPDNKDLATKIENPTNGYIYEALNCFSLNRNISFVLKTDVGKSDLSYLHGIRVISLFWVIYLHVAEVPLNFPIINNLNDAVRLLQRRSSMVAINGGLSVDTFFLLSGLLVVYVNSKKAEKNNGKINWIKFYFHRICRLTPSYMLAILFVTKLNPFFGNGPLWFLIIRGTKACSDYWWTNFLYINNFVHTHLDEICIGQTWYLANDMQFFIVSPALIIFGYRFGLRPLIAFSSVIILASITTTTSIIGGRDISVMSPPTINPLDVEAFAVHFRDVYIKPYCRIQPYIVGMVMGFVLFKHFSTKFKIQPYKVVGAWILAIAVGVAIVYAPHNAVKENPRIWTTAENVIYGGLRWILWSFCISWVIFACHYGYAGIIRHILSAKFWIPLSRMNYLAFILHMDVLNVLFFNIETPVHFTAFTQVTYYLAVLVLSYAVAFVFTVVVELPFSNLEFHAWRSREK